MSRLFIELYLDEDVDVLVAALLRAHGFIAVTAQAAGRKGEDDDEQYAYTQNDPVNFVDPLGLNMSSGSSGGWRSRR